MLSVRSDKILFGNAKIFFQDSKLENKKLKDIPVKRMTSAEKQFECPVYANAGFLLAL